MWRILWDNKELLASTMFPLVFCALLNGLNTVYSSISQCGSYSVCCTRTQRHVSLQCYGKRISETNFKRATEKIPVNWGHLSYLGNTLYLSRDSCDVHLWNNSFSFPDHSGTASLSLQNFPELNKLSICLRKSFFFSPGLCENSGQFQIIQTGDCECMQAWLCVCVCINVCLPEGRRSCVLTVSGVQALISPSSTLSPSHASFIWKRSRHKERKNYFWIIKDNLSVSKSGGPCP